MHSSTAGSFNKEKLIFLIGSAVVAAGLYLFLTSGPIPLTPGAPVSYSQARPEAVKMSEIAAREEEDFYVVDGKVSKIIDKRTKQLVNRDRKSPFEPYSTFATRAPAKMAVANNAPPPPPPPPAPEKPKDSKKDWVGTTAEAEVEFMGVMTMADGETFGLLKPKDGSPTIRVKLGSEIEAGGTKYTVTALEKQAIWVTDGDQRPFILKDTSFDGSDDTSSADSSDAKSTSTNSKPAPKPAKKDATQTAQKPATQNPNQNQNLNNGQRRPRKNRNNPSGLKG